MTFSLLSQLLCCSQRQKWRIPNLNVFEWWQLFCERIGLGSKILHKHPKTHCTLWLYESGTQLLVLRSPPGHHPIVFPGLDSWEMDDSWVVLKLWLSSFKMDFVPSSVISVWCSANLDEGALFSEAEYVRMRTCSHARTYKLYMFRFSQLY